MSTPEFSGFSTIKNKYSPFYKGINKNLLTPCRQVGLSRKRKTSFNSSAKSSENVNINVIGINNCPGDERTPVTHSERTKNKKSILNFQTTPQELFGDHVKKRKENEKLQQNDIKICKKDLLQSFTSEDLFDTKDDQPSAVEKDENVLAETIGNAHQISNEELVENEKNNVIQSTPVHKNLNEPKKRKLSSDFTNFESVCIKNEKSFGQTSESDNSDDDFVIINSSKTKQKRIEIRSKRASNTSVEDSSEKDNQRKTNCIKKCKIQLQKLCEDEIKSNNPFDNNKSNTINKKYSSNSIDDADFFTSTPEKERMKRKNLEKKMALLENQVRQKRSILENLERASVYKGKHNIPELKQLTSLWLDGCAQGLNDLLTLLQAHGPIDLATLLNNLQIPKEIVAKLPL